MNADSLLNRLRSLSIIKQATTTIETKQPLMARRRTTAARTIRVANGANLYRVWLSLFWDV